MKPLTLDCARARQHLDDYHDGELAGEDLAFVEAHLAACEGCKTAHEELRRALAALASLSREDIERLRSPLPDAHLDAQPLSRLLFVSLAAIFCLIAGVTILTAIRMGEAEPELETAVAAPQEPSAVTKRPAVIPLPEIGFEIGVEVETVAEVQPPTPNPTPVDDEPPSPVDPSPPPVVIARKEPEPPAPIPPAVKKQDPAKKKGNKPAVVVAQKKPLPKSARAFIQGLELSKGLRYRDVTFFFLRTPDGRDRLGSLRKKPFYKVKEASPRTPERCVVRRGKKGRVLLGELLDAPLGLRIAPATHRLGSRTTLTVIPMAWDGLNPGKRDAILKSQVLIPSDARRAIVEGTQPGPIALFLKALTDTSFPEQKRLALDLARLEPEAQELERRLRARIQRTRGLRGVAMSIKGKHRSLDLFGSSKDLSAAFPKLVRSALLEARINQPLPDDDVGADPRPTRIEVGVQETRKAYRQLLTLLSDSSEASFKKRGRREIDRLFRVTDKKLGVGVVYLANGKVVHALAVAR